MFKFHGRFRKGQTLILGDERLLRPKFMTNFKDMLDTIRWGLSRAMSGDLDISRFTANKLSLYRKIAYE